MRAVDLARESPYGPLRRHAKYRGERKSGKSGRYMRAATGLLVFKAGIGILNSNDSDEIEALAKMLEPLWSMEN